MYRQSVGRFVSNSETQMLREQIKMVNENSQRRGFCEYILLDWGKKPEGEPADAEWLETVSSDQLGLCRKQAYHRFLKATRGIGLAKSTTIQKWFGLEGRGKPKREKIFQMALYLGYTVEKTNSYLMEGILEPGIQVNDYREFIYQYGLEHHLSYEECQKMICFFEGQLYQDMVVEQHTHTDELIQLYRDTHCKDSEEFLIWMCQCAGMFKGYSRTTFHYFESLKSQILEFMRQDARTYLNCLLEETGFEKWYHSDACQMEEKGEALRRYLKNDARRKTPELTQEQREQIMELYWTAYVSHDKNTDLLAEIYAAAIDDGNRKSHSHQRGRYFEKQEFSLPHSICFMTDKVVSQIMGVAACKERQIRLIQQLANLGETESKEVKELKRRLAREKKESHLIQRTDLLPLIHYVAQQQYEEERQKQNAPYQQEAARQYFETLANGILSACQMATLSWDYEMDALLLSCYCPGEMFSFSDMLEQARMMESE